MAEGRTITYREAIIEAIDEEMERDPSIVLLGEDIGAAGGVFQQTKGLFDKFGAGRVIDTPISESGAFGIAVGAAMSGLRPIFEVMFNDFITLIMDQLANQAAKVRYMSAGQVSAPLVVRTSMGAGSNLGPQHSQSLYAWACHVPGLKVVVPSAADDAKALFKAAIRDDDPVLVFEDRLLYGHTALVDADPGAGKLGEARVRRFGRDITIVAVGRMVPHALTAAEMLAEDGISAEIVDPRSLVPLDVGAICASVRKTNRALVVDGGVQQYGAAAEIAATISREAFDWLDAPVHRLCAANVPIPVSRSLEPLVQPSPQSIYAEARALMVGAGRKAVVS